MPEDGQYTDEEKAGNADDPFKKLNDFLDDIRDAGMRVTNRWKEMWLIALKYAWGEQLQLPKKDLMKDWHYIVVNRIRPLMFQNIAKLAKNHPKVLTFPWSDEKEGVAEFVENWAGILQYIWESPYELSMRLKLIMGLLDAAVFGYMVGKTYWDSRVQYEQADKKWTGNVRQSFIHPANFWADPSAESMSKEYCENCGTKRRVKLEWALNKWPKEEDAITKESYTSSDAKYIDGELLIYKDQKASTIDLPSRFKFTKLVSLILRQGYQQDNMVEESGSEQRYVTIEEIYWKDYSVKHVEIKDNVSSDTLKAQGIIAQETRIPDGAFMDAKTNKEFVGPWPPKTVTKEYDEPKFPEGRFVLRIGRTILNPKEDEQQYKRKRWPFTVMPYHILPHMWQGGNAVEMARNNNDILNLTVSALVRRTLLTADPERVLESGSLALDRKGKMRQKRPRGIGKYIVMAKGKIDKIRNLEYAKLDSATMLLAQILKQDIDDSMFMQDVARGAAGARGGLAMKGSGPKSATEAKGLEINSQDYTFLQSIFLDSWIDNTLTDIAEIVQQEYKPDRIVRIIGDDREKKNHKLTQEFLDVRFDVNIEPGSTLPFDEQQKKEDYAAAYKILENPNPNPLLEDMLRILGISNRKKILNKHQGTILFREFIIMGQMLQELDPAIVEAALRDIPELQPLVELLMKAAQLNIAVEGKEQQTNV